MEEDRKKRIIEKGCPKCSGEFEYIGYNKFQCKKCKEKFRVKRPRHIVDPSDQSTWRAKCDECGGIMDYYNLKYCCRKCGNILEV